MLLLRDLILLKPAQWNLKAARLQVYSLAMLLRRNLVLLKLSPWNLKAARLQEMFLQMTLENCLETSFLVDRQKLPMSGFRRD